MTTVYQVTISPAGKEKLFNITWFNQQTRKENSFKQSAAKLQRNSGNDGGKTTVSN